MPKPTKSTDLASSLGQVLKQRRHEKGLSAENVADAANVSRRSYADWEAGKSAPKLEGLQALAAFYGLSTSTLLREAGW